METKKNFRQDLADYAGQDNFIIAIGASAGGLEAINILFDNTPSDEVSYIIIQHLAPDHKSLMAQLLENHSKLEIYIAENEMPVLSNSIYLLPEGKNMTISGGKLYLKERLSSTPNTAIDIFFNSLAVDQGSKSIGIILAGNGDDGRRGIEAIKKVGGMVIVQAPDSTNNNSMPDNAILSKFYDYILAPAQIPSQIINYIKQRKLDSYFSDELSTSNEKALLDILDLVKKHTPLNFSDYKRPTIIRRIIRRIISSNLNTIEEYIEYLKSNPDEVEVLSKDFLISVTKFFRDPEAFEIIEKKVIPKIIDNKLIVDTLRVWVIGCATGEEAYSIAILIKEHLIEIKKDLEVKIFASDIDQDALAKASRGYYPESIKNDVSQDRLDAFFLKEDNKYKVRDNIRKMVVFASHDIAYQPPYGKMDLICCRNLLIYLNTGLQSKIFSIFHNNLNSNGYLFLGSSEGPGNQKHHFQEIDHNWKIYKNIQGNYAFDFSSYIAPRLDAKKISYSTISLKNQNLKLTESIHLQINKSLIEETGYQASVCIDANKNVILAIGNVDKYLVPKLFSNNILELLPHELSISIATSIKQVITKNIRVEVKNVRFSERRVRFLAKPITSDNNLQSIVIILFKEEEEESPIVESGIVEIFEDNLYSKKYETYLEKELEDTKDKLKESNDSLDEMVGNIQTYNEELVSSNEEMQSTNEELQSINEELSILNSEYQLKIKELAILNDDLDNYFRSTHISQLYVDSNLVIRKFNPVAMQQINIKESDIGRPLVDISTNIKFSTLINDIKTVIDTQRPKEKEIEIQNGKYFSMMIVPYIRQKDNKTDGAIITFHDISEIKKSKKIIEETNTRLMKINEEHNTFTYSASHDLKAPLNNMEGLLSLINHSNDIVQIKSLTVPLIKSVISLKKTIDELAFITRIEDEPKDTETVNVQDIFNEVKNSISNTLISSNVKINAEFEEKEISFSRKNLRSILLNFLSNAVKYRALDRELEVTISTFKDNGFLKLIFQDNGIGIAENQLNSIFTKFTRLHSTETEVEGSGVGLFLVKKIIENEHGEIEVKSKQGQGTTFTISFKN